MLMEQSYAAQLPLAGAAYFQVRPYEDGITKEVYYAAEVVFPDDTWDHVLWTRSAENARQEVQRHAAALDKPVRAVTGAGLKLGGGY